MQALPQSSTHSAPAASSRNNVWTTTTALVLLLLCAAVRQADAALITVGTRVELTPTTFALPIEIADGVELSEWFFDLTYDATDVQINMACDPFGADPYCSLLTGPVTEGDFFASSAPFSLLVPGFVQLDPGTQAQTGLLFGVHGAFGGSAPGPSDSGTLAFVQFILLGNGESPIDVDDGSVVTVPEPAAVALVATGLLLLGAPALRRRSRGGAPGNPNGGAIDLQS